MREITLSVIIRWCLTVVLLAVVWFHAHWSVAFAISGLTVAEEIRSVVLP